MTDIAERFEYAINLRNEGNLSEAINEFVKIISLYPDDPRIAGVYITMAGVYGDLDDYDNAIINFESALDLNRNSELASLGLYVSYAMVGRDHEAISELKRYLDGNPAILYKDTLVELLEDLKDGYMSAC